MKLESSFSITCGSRLHFGLWAWGPDHPRQFGGVGMMINQPRLTVRFALAEKFEAAGPLADRVATIAKSCATRWRLDTLPACRIEVIDQPPQHAGFGVGTQLGLAVARGIAECCGLGEKSPDELSLAAGRGLRSAVGTHGFALGGLLVDAGKSPSDEVGTLAKRVAVPSEWRVLLITPNTNPGMAGEAERAAFAKLPPVPIATTKHLEQIAFDRIVPACENSDFDRFATAIYEYGHLAGLCFAAVQGGAYSTPQTAELVSQLRELGAAGVGQSSWGPTVFAFAPNETEAIRLRDALLAHSIGEELSVLIAQPMNEGARVLREAVG
jgi:beta-ribofuranosylaminobenzene 5'-phosphate synthase